KGNIAGEQRGAYRLASGSFRSDRASEALMTDAQVRALAATAGQELTYTCVPPGSGQRIGVDRDGDGAFDRDELDAGSDPADPSSLPPGATTTTVTTSTTSTTTTLPCIVIGPVGIFSPKVIVDTRNGRGKVSAKFCMQGAYSASYP